ncbi:DUF2219 family protein [Candidatus Kapabacteria bacterium]|nr:DUF2219 family protein [Candidatus Kapabacteria bacterium]
MKLITYLILLLFSVGLLESEEKDESINEKGNFEKVWINGVGTFVDQDLIAAIFKLNRDQNYTHGQGMQLFSSRLTNEIYKNDDDKFIFNLPSKISIKVAGFTPDELRDTLPVVGDRPYFSALWLGLDLQRVDQNKFKHTNRSFYFGIMGIRNVADKIQSSIHNGMNNNNTEEPYDPVGWHNQISNGGEPTAYYQYKITKLITTKSLSKESLTGNISRSNRWRNQFTYNLGYSIGYVTNANIGISGRSGIIDLRNWYSGNSWISSNISSKKNNNNKNRYFNTSRINELYFSYGLNASFTTWNSALLGQFKETSYALQYDELGFLVIDGRAALEFVLRDINFTFYMGFKTPEFWTNNSRIHSWGGITLNWQWFNRNAK